MRTQSASLASELRAALGRSVVEGVQAPPNYSVLVEGKGRAARYVLYRATCLVLRTRSRARVVRALEACLQAHRGSPRRLRLRQTVVLSEAGALLLPPELFHRVEAVEGPLRGAGLWLADPPFAVLDPGSGALVVEGDGARPAPVRFWSLLRRDRDRPVARSEVLAAALRQLVRDSGVPARQGLRALFLALSGAQVAAIWYEGGNELTSRLVQAAEAGVRA